VKFYGVDSGCLSLTH